MIVISLAGEGLRFKGKFDIPKPLIPVNGKPMMYWAVNSLPKDQKKLFLVKKEEQKLFQDCLARDGLVNDGDRVYGLPEKFKGYVPAICHVYSNPYIKNIDENEELLICDCDSIIPESQIEHAIKFFKDRNATGGVTIRFIYPDDPKKNYLSYCKVDNWWKVYETREKDPFTAWSTTGPYWWAKAKYFFKAAKAMIEANDNFNGDFYNSPVYNYHLKDEDSKVMAYRLIEFYHLGSPEELDNYLQKR